MIGHSDGSTTAGMAARAELDADRLVLVGSPGASATNARDDTIPRGEVYAATTPDDPIRWTPDSVHGTNPTDSDFDAQVFTTTGATGHSEYFELGTDSLENLAKIALDLEPVLLADDPR